MTSENEKLGKWKFEFDIMEVTPDGMVKFQTKSENDLGEILTERELRAISACLAKTAERFLEMITGKVGALPPISSGGEATN